jgi:hypothetical protein
VHDHEEVAVSVKMKSPPGALTRICEECHRRIRGDTGYICVNFVAAALSRNGSVVPFHIWHARCDPNSENLDYWFRIQCESAEELLAQIAELVAQKWFASTGWQSLLRRIVADADWYPTTRPGRKRPTTRSGVQNELQESQSETEYEGAQHE